MIKILAFDPATVTCGVALTAQTGSEPVKLEMAYALKLDKDASIATRLVELRKAVISLIEAHKPTAVVVEQVRFNFRNAVNIDSLSKVIESVGVVCEAAKSMGIEPIRLSASQVRAAIGNKAKKNKKVQTKAIVQLRFKDDLTAIGLFPIKGTQLDISDAIALAWVGRGHVNG